MVEQLRDPDSSDKHLSTVRRHIRLCKAAKGAEFLVTAIEPHQTHLNQKLSEKKLAVEAEEDAGDDRNLRGREAADTLRTASERSKQFDRDNPGEDTFSKVYPEGGFSGFIASNGTTSAASCRLIATRVRALGANHPLSNFETDLNSRATTMDDAQKALDDALRGRKLAEAEEELAQAALRRAYEENSLDAQKKFGKALAERLFPRLRKRETPDDDDDEGN